MFSFASSNEGAKINTRPAPADPVHVGNQAQRLLDDPVLQIAFERLAADLTANWRNTAVGERDQREEAYRLLWAIEGVKSKLRAMVGNAKVIAAEMERREAGRAHQGE